jgi:isocitrate dehydrogenase
LATVEVGLGIKAVSKVGTERLIKAAIDYAIANNQKSVTIVHKGNIMKFTEGGFRDWSYKYAETHYGDKPTLGHNGSALKLKKVKKLQTKSRQQLCSR